MNALYVIRHFQVKALSIIILNLSMKVCDTNVTNAITKHQEGRI